MAAKKTTAKAAAKPKTAAKTAPKKTEPKPEPKAPPAPKKFDPAAAAEALGEQEWDTAEEAVYAGQAAEALDQLAKAQEKAANLAASEEA